MRRCLIVLLGAVLAFTADGDVKITILAGAGGNIRAGSLSPVQVILENDETDRDGRVTAVYRMPYAPSMVSATRSVPLPPHSTKRVFLYLPTPEGYANPDRILVRYETRGGNKIAELEERVITSGGDLPIVCALGTAPPGLPALRQGEKDQYKLLMLQPEQIPDRPEGLEMYDALIVAPAPFAPLDRAQVLAIRDWVLRGGTLIVDVSARADSLRDEVFALMLPLAPVGTQQAALQVFQREVPFASGNVAFGKALFESDGHPLAVRGSYGLGSVTCFAIDPSAAFFVEWPGREALWNELFSGLRLGQEPADDDYRRYTGFGYVANEVYQGLAELVTNAPSTPLRLGLVLFLTAIYALAVGPGDFFFVRRIRRPKLTWLTFPGMVAAFTIGAYIGAKEWVGGELSTLNVQRVVCFPQPELTIYYDLTSLFAPEGNDYEVRDTNEGFLRHVSAEYDMSQRLRMNGDDLSIVQRIPIWTRRIYGASRTVPGPGPVDLTLKKENDVLMATIANHSEWTLHD
ncbi:MAG: hypothetical protein HY706_07260, partial [Candidatus Hydrogenedentes bacterium]|nr:hypothetical protein [Candidatus Hydrogenedentota bacterium]